MTLTLSTTEKNLIQESWEEYHKGDLVDQGVHMFIHIFEKRPDLKHLWKFTAEGDSAEKYKKNPKFRYHIKRLWATLAIVIDGMEFPDDLEEVLEDLGKRHNKFNVNQSHFEPVGDGILFAISNALGNKFTPETREAWTKLYTFVATVMMRKLVA